MTVLSVRRMSDTLLTLLVPLFFIGPPPFTKEKKFHGASTVEVNKNVPQKFKKTFFVT